MTNDRHQDPSERKPLSNPALDPSVRLREIERFVATIDELRNPFVYGVLYSRDDWPDTPIHLVPHFAQRADDIVLEQIHQAMSRKDQRASRPLRYLDIGAGHPVAGSNTFLFHARGSTGVLVEANPKLLDRLRSSRANDEILHFAVTADYQKSVRLVIASKSELSTTVEESLSRFPDAQAIDVIDVPGININDLFERFWKSGFFNILSMDVEGLDLDLISVADFKTYAFDIIVVEHNDASMPGSLSLMERTLSRARYRLVALNTTNAIFVHEHQDLSQPSEASSSLRGVGLISKRNEYKSFDVFDTLIARRSISPNATLEKLRPKYGDLLTTRLSLDDGTRSLEMIYKLGDLPMAMMDDEIQIEIDDCIPVKEHLDEVNDGDLLISDTYLPEKVVRNLLQAAGLSKRVGLHVSNADKRLGKIWPTLSTRPDVHIGDNSVSDIEVPKSFGFNVRLTTNTAPTEYERFLLSHNVSMAQLVRELRLRHACSTTDVWSTLQIETNIPMLISLSSLLVNKKERIVFLGRDCQSLHRIFSTLFERDCTYLPFSREFARNVDVATEYLAEHSAEDDVLFDLVSSGKTWSLLPKIRNVCVAIHQDQVSTSSTPDNFSYFYSASALGGTALAWEYMNCADHGMLTKCIDAKIGWYEWAEHELPKEFVNTMQEIVTSTIEILPNYDRDELLSNPALFEICHARMRSLVEQSPSEFESLQIADEISRRLSAT